MLNCVSFWDIEYFTNLCSYLPSCTDPCNGHSCKRNQYEKSFKQVIFKNNGQTTDKIAFR